MRAFFRHAPIAILVLLAACGPDPEPQPTPAPVPDTEAAAPVETEVSTMEIRVFSQLQLACLARAAYFEARGEGEPGMAAVIHVVMNRTEAPAYPDDPCSVVTQTRGVKCQFSWACDGRSDEPANVVAYGRALEVAQAVLSGELADPTDGAVMFHAARVSPYWVAAAEKTAEIGSHVFYRLDE